MTTFRLAESDTSSGRDSVCRILIGVCGSANIINLPSYITALSASRSVEINVVMTRTAASLIPPSTLSLLCDKVYCDGVDQLAVSHVTLSMWADVFMVLPATANILGQVAHGLATGLLSSALLASKPPVLFFPTMNSRMWEQKSVGRNVAQLRADGHVVIDPVQGQAWEIATRSILEAFGLPSPTAVDAVVQEFQRLKTAGGLRTSVPDPGSDLQ